MKKIYSVVTGASLLLLTGLAPTQSIAQPICGGIVQNFDNTSGSTAGFTGEMQLATTGPDGFLLKDRVIASAVYTVTTPTYQLPASANFIGYGFILEGTERVARAEIKIMYISTFNNEMTTIFLGQFVPSYNPNQISAEICRAVSISDLPGFPVGGRYRFLIELTPNTGTGAVGQTISFDDFRTNGTFSLTPLPVNFISFSAKKLVENTVQLTWQVAGEDNVSHYEVERSSNGRQFSSIGSISRTGKDVYTYTDLTGGGNDAFYRVKNVDNDGKFKYSGVIRFVGGQIEASFKIFPQPAANQVTLQHPVVNGKASLTLSTADGRNLRSINPGAGTNQTIVDLNGLQPGVYFLRFVSGDKIQSLKVIKN